MHLPCFSLIARVFILALPGDDGLVLSVIELQNFNQSDLYAASITSARTGSAYSGHPDISYYPLYL